LCGVAGLSGGCADNAAKRLSAERRHKLINTQIQHSGKRQPGSATQSIYNEHHFFIKNPINRFSVGTKNKDLKFNTDGSLTIYVQAEAPADPVQRANWLPAPKGDFSLYVRAYWPKAATTDGSWTPPPVQKTS